MVSQNQAKLLLFVTSSVLNVPCGIYRTTTEKFSIPWFLAIHAPIPFVVMLRRSRLAGSLPKRIALPFTLLGAVVGQIGGGRAFDLGDDRRVQTEPLQAVDGSV